LRRRVIIAFTLNPPDRCAMPLIFSYGTLQQDNVQLSTFGRLLEGHGDELVGAEKSLLRIDDEKVVATSGRADHPVVRLNGLATSRVRGTVYEITDAELARADRYEVAAYKRVAVVLASGKEAWVYVDARSSEEQSTMSAVHKSGTFTLGRDRSARRLGYGAMQLAGPGVFGPPKDPEAALAVLREAVASGVNHIDTSDYYGPHVTNQLIRKALHPYADDLLIVTKVGARRGADGSWRPAFSPPELIQAVHDNLRNLGLDVLDVVNLRSMFGIHGPAAGSIEVPLSALAELQQKGLVRHIGLSNVTPAQIEEGRRICEIVCVQNQYNLAHRADDALIDKLANHGIAYVPFFPLGGFTPLQSSTLSAVAQRLDATPMQVALAWLLRRAPNILLIPGTSSIAHLRENLAAAALELPENALTELNEIGTHSDAA
jgi:pyridoxine 4-dehydrogenase